MLGVQGRHGDATVSPFMYRAMQADQPTRMMMPTLGREHLVLAEAYTDDRGRQSARPLRQIVLRMPDDRMECVPFPRAWTAIQLRAAIDRRGLGRGTLEEVYFEDDEVVDPETDYMRTVRTLLSEVFGTFGAQAFGGAGETSTSRVEMVAGISAIYLRAIAKTAFHYFLWACPVLRGDEAVFRAVRDFISDGVGSWREFVNPQAPQFLPVLRGNAPVRTSHFFHASLTSTAAVAFVQFFAGPHGVPPPSRVELAQNPLAVHGSHFSCHQACYFDDEADRDDGHDGELVPIETWERRIIMP